jgi:hypothetical protein
MLTKEQALGIADQIADAFNKRPPKVSGLALNLIIIAAWWLAIAFLAFYLFKP